MRLFILAQVEATPKGLSFADYAIIAAFFVVMLFIGFYYAGRMRNLKDFFSGGRQVPWWLSGASLWMTSFSAFSFVAYSELAYKYGFVAVAFWWFLIPCPVISAYFFAARWRRAASTSPLEYIETRYGPGLRQGLAWLGIPMTIIDDGTKLFAIGTMVAVAIEPVTLGWGILLSGTIMLAYTFLGGLWAVLVTDFVQFVVMLLAVAVLVPLAFSRVGGFTAFYEATPTGFFAPTSAEGGYTWMFILAFFVIQIFAYCTKWPFVQRYYSVKSDVDARKVGYFVALLGWVGPPILYFPAMAARVFMPDVDNTGEVYALLCKHLLPIGMVGMIVAAMFSATMSMLSSDYNAVASVMTNDVYKRLCRRRAGDRELLLVGRLSTLIAGLIALAAAYAVMEIRRTSPEHNLFDIMATLFSILLPPIALPMMFGLLSRRISTRGGLAGFLLGAAAGVGVFLFAFLLPDYQYLLSVKYMTWITTFPTLLGLGIFSAVFPNSAAKNKQIDHFLRYGLEEEGVPAPAASGNQGVPAIAETGAPPPSVNPFPIIGASIGSLGVVAFLVMLGSIVTLDQVTLRDGSVTLVVSFIMFLIGLGCWTLGLRQNSRSLSRENGS